MRISPKYQKRLDSYVLWSKCTTPFTEGPSGAGKIQSHYGNPSGPTAAECLMSRESLGKSIEPSSEPGLLSIYILGKANRDWWFKEIGDKNDMSCRDSPWSRMYVQEETVNHLLPECFCELFGRWPRTHLVRYYFDNNYSTEQFDSDAKLLFEHGIEREQGGASVVCTFAQTALLACASL